jgi:hypothetical protein
MDKSNQPKKEIREQRLRRQGQTEKTKRTRIGRTVDGGEVKMDKNNQPKKGDKGTAFAAGRRNRKNQKIENREKRKRRRSKNR